MVDRTWKSSLWLYLEGRVPGNPTWPWPCVCPKTRILRPLSTLEFVTLPRMRSGEAWAFSVINNLLLRNEQTKGCGDGSETGVESQDVRSGRGFQEFGSSTWKRRGEAS
ncbi:hypothetical protein VULLAG_LOCUS9787 [Vulpes lagopus]